jgi:peptidoglycan/LPS O-acetylase OafA/YrhL
MFLLDWLLYLLEGILYLVAFGISLVAAIIQYRFFPMNISRRERWRTSDWDYQKNRFLKSVALFIFVMVITCAMVYGLFHPETVE